MPQIYCTRSRKTHCGHKEAHMELSIFFVCFLCFFVAGFSSVIVAAVAVDLATNFAERPSRAVNVYVSSTGTNRLDQFIEFTGANTPLIRQVSNIRRGNGARYRRWWCRTGLRPCGAIAEIGAKEHADRASHALLSEMDMGLLDSAFKVGVAKLPINSRFIIADTRIECSVTRGRDC